MAKVCNFIASVPLPDLVEKRTADVCADLVGMLRMERHRSPYLSEMITVLAEKSLEFREEIDQQSKVDMLRKEVQQASQRLECELFDEASSTQAEAYFRDLELSV